MGHFPNGFLWGTATADDTRRIEYTERALHGVANCLKDGLDVRGYTY